MFDVKNTTAWNDIVHQFDLVHLNTIEASSGLLVHGWCETKDCVWADPQTGRAPNVWGRAVGWYVMALIETLQVFPRTHPGYKKLLGYYTSLAAALKKTQDPASGGWYQVMNEPYPTRQGNYIEASGSAMFTYGLLKGIKLGYISKVDYLAVAQKAYKGLVKQFISPQQDGTLQFTGTVAECGLVTSNVTFEVSNNSNSSQTFNIPLPNHVFALIE